MRVDRGAGIGKVTRWSALFQNVWHFRWTTLPARMRTSTTTIRILACGDPGTHDVELLFRCLTDLKEA